MLNPTCPLTKKEQLYVVLHHECNHFQPNTDKCKDCSYFVPLHRANIRRLILKMEKDLGNILHNNSLFHINKQGIINAFDSYLHPLSQRNLIRDYRVVCDDVNNPNPNNKETVIDVWIRPTMSVEFININMKIVAP